MKTAYVLFGHGSRPQPQALRSLQNLANWTSQALGQEVFDAYMELEEPSLEARVAERVGLGAQRVVVIPAFFSLGVHLRQDIPQRFDALKQAFSQTQFIMTEHLGAQPDLAQVAIKRIQASAS
jgi:sirohydrochlorin cobaltochelatase